MIERKNNMVGTKGGITLSRLFYDIFPELHAANLIILIEGHADFTQSD